MEKLKSLVPINLKQMISESTTEDLYSTCSKLLEFFLPLPQFQRVVGDLTDPEIVLCRKSIDAALDSKRKGNECFSSGNYSKALSFYTEALRFAPMNVDDMDNDLVATLYVNRASSMHKMGLLKECIRDCNRAVVLSPQYVKAWYRKGKANASLENYEDAIHDLNVALSIEGSLAGKNHIKDELEVMSNHCKGTTRTSGICNEDDEKEFDSRVEPYLIKLQCISTPAKGRGMASLNDIPPASLVHSEEPYAAIILKHCRETHCHFCFNELPADTIPCSSCTIPLYCSQHCQEQAGGKHSHSKQNSYTLHQNMSSDLERSNADTTLASSADNAVLDPNLVQISEHRHECGGVHWPAVLPAEIVLAGRILVKKTMCFRGALKPMEALELSHNYPRMSPDSKLESLIYSIVLTYCLHQFYGSQFPFTGASASQLVILISQISVNSMAVVHMKSLDAYGTLDQLGKLSTNEDASTSNVEQVRVGQAIYARGSLFNHSCQPNIHAYFLSRTLFLRSTEFVQSGYPVELSYGPQVGQWDLQDRQDLLENQYYFKCECSGCAELNLADLVIHAFRCVKSNCFGIVLDRLLVKHEELEDNCLQDAALPWHLPLRVCKQKKEAINEVARLLPERTDDMLHIGPGYCLSCASHRDLESSHAAAKKAGMDIKRLQDAITSKEVPNVVLSNALKAFNLLKSVRHAYSKDIGQAEDNLAQAFCLIGEFESALDHCKASIEILEKLYQSDHIVIGNELVKLASIQLSLNDHISAIKSINRVDAIFSLYYGSHAARIFPYLKNLRREADKHAPQ